MAMALLPVAGMLLTGCSAGRAKGPATPRHRNYTAKSHGGQGKLTTVGELTSSVPPPTPIAVCRQATMKAAPATARHRSGPDRTGDLRRHQQSTKPASSRASTTVGVHRSAPATPDRGRKRPQGDFPKARLPGDLGAR